MSVVFVADILIVGCKVECRNDESMYIYVEGVCLLFDERKEG